MTEYDPNADGIRSYYAALEAKRARGDTHFVKKQPVDYDLDPPPLETEFPAQTMTWLQVAILIATAIGIGGLILWAGRAEAHDAPAGWSYPFSCCSGLDCREVADQAIGETATGYKIKATNELISYGDTRIKDSPSGRFHRCSVAGADDSRTICLFIPPRSF